MITFILLSIITVLVLGVAIALLGAGGSIFLILSSDIIVACGIIWLLFWLFKKKKK